MAKRSEVDRRHIPRRTCVACRQVRSPRELIRVVRLPSGAVEVDESGKKPGRGAYLCPDKSCWERALSKTMLEHALKTQLAKEEKETLWQRCSELPVEPVGQNTAAKYE
ncbi:MAG: YlxR family protein [Anaerolineae bacterium]|nr:YlxR family protein [Anaerolineae bacterium]